MDISITVYYYLIREEKVVNYCIEYMLEIRRKVLDCSTEKIYERMQKNCQKTVLQLSNSIIDLINSFQIVSEKSYAFITKYIQDLEAKDEYLYIIQTLNKLQTDLINRSGKTIPHSDRRHLFKVLSELKRRDLHIHGFSSKTFQRMRQGQSKLTLDKIYPLIEYFYHPELECITTGFDDLFLVSSDYIYSIKKQIGGHETHINTLEVLIDSPPQKEERIDFLYNMFRTLYALDEKHKMDIQKKKIWDVVYPLFQSERGQIDISDDDLIQIKEELFTKVKDDYNFYTKVLGSNNLFENNGFKTILFYRFYNKLYRYGEKMCDEIWQILADKIYRRSIFITHNVLHPQCIINVPCYICGTNIYVGKGCSVGARCHVYDNVTIMGRNESTSYTEDFQQETIIEANVIINSSSILLPGAHIANGSQLESGSIISSK